MSSPRASPHVRLIDRVAEALRLEAFKLELASSAKPDALVIRLIRRKVISLLAELDKVLPDDDSGASIGTGNP